MSKSILVGIRGKPFGVFSNKTNAWKAILSQFEDFQLAWWSQKRNRFLMANYALIANQLKKEGKIMFVDADKAHDDVTETLVPIVQIYQFETNWAADGNLYKSNTEDALDPQEEAGESLEPEPEQTATVGVQQ